ncbi:hypothetical protein [Kitasatospora mediocidica]|uniref:hypothetical protein n=1 Tax=Kitasatospora mediocidica TaxID=58352 RepID=UPI000691E266|nr:hypothetical protein [Kitasatospora mediocidica]
MSGLPLTTPYSWNVADSFTASIGNGIRDQLTFLQKPPVFVGYQGTSQSLGNQTWTPLGIDVAAIDSYGGHSTTTNPSRYTCQPGAGGWYTVCGVYAPTANSTGFRAVKIQVNGVAVYGASIYAPSMGPEVGLATPTRDFLLNPGDYVEVCGWQSSGGSLGTVLDSDMRSGLWVRWSHA